MRAITIRQPHAWAVIHGGRHVENRAVPWMWHSAVGERVAVHAAARLTGKGLASPLVAAAWADAYRFVPLTRDRLARSAVLGTVHVAGVHTPEECGGTCSRWADPDAGCHIVLTDPEPCPPMFVGRSGKPGLWHLPADFHLPQGSRNAGHSIREVAG